MLPYQLPGEPNFLLIGISAVFGLFVIIIVYYIFISKIKNSNTYSKNLQEISQQGDRVVASPTNAGSLAKTAASVPINSGGTYSPNPSSTTANTNPIQVFNIKENIYTLDDAPGVCGALGANVASMSQLIDAHKKGADWCNVGWTKDGLAAYPIQMSTWQTLQDNEPGNRNICGSPGINLVRNDPNLLYGVNCYGVKPNPKGNELIKGAIVSDKQAAINAKIAQFQKNINNIGVVAFNANSWSE